MSDGDLPTVDSPTRPSAPTCPGLISLPHELLERIVREVAPNGGRAAGNLHLTSLHLAEIAGRVAWTSLHLPQAAEAQGRFLAALLWGQEGRARRVVSVRIDIPSSKGQWTGGIRRVLAELAVRLPRLSRLHIAGGGEGSASPHLPPDLWAVFPTFGNLRALVLDGVDLSRTPDGVSRRLHLDQLVLRNCTMAYRLIFNKPQERVQEPLLPLATRSVQVAGGAHPGVDDLDGVVVLCGCLGSAQNLTTSIAVPPAEVLINLLLSPWERDEAQQVTLKSFTLTGLADLFGPDSEYGIRAIEFAARILRLVARGPLEKLSLPVGNVFLVHPTLTVLHLPSVTILRLATEKESQGSHRDVYTFKSHLELAKIVAPFPSLTTLHLKGWFNHTGVLRLAAAFFSPESKYETESSTIHPPAELFSKLLDLLRETRVVELRLTNSEGHREGDAECCLWREDAEDGVWRSRLVNYW